jgi:ClpP class serine protease
VAASRELEPAYVDSIGQGRVWSGTRGLRNGLVDEIGGLWHSIALAKRAAGLAADETIEFVEAPGRGPFDWGFLQPRLPGLHGDAGQEDALPLGFTAGVTGILSPAERDYWRRLFQAGGRPIFMIEPIEIDDGGWRP